MILIRKAYRGHYLEIRSVVPQDHAATPRCAQVWLDGERLNGPCACATVRDTEHLLDEAKSYVDALQAQTPPQPSIEVADRW